jgi:ribose 5-phosphate isomerase A
MSSDENKKQAALAALSYIEDRIVLGVGTGSTVEFFIEQLPQHASRLRAVVSSSMRTTAKLAQLGLRVAELPASGEIDLYVDGADEATKERLLIKGGGGALSREKILAAAAARFVCIADESKLVDVLGGFPLPIEVIPMARAYVARQMIGAGGRPVWRENFLTDNGNHIIDVHDLRITSPLDLEQRFNQIPGVVTVGIFARRPADVLLLGAKSGARVIE